MCLGEELRLTEATHMVFRSPISSLTLFSLFMRVRTRARLASESLRASVAVRSTESAVVWCLQDGRRGNRDDGEDTNI